MAFLTLSHITRRAITVLLYTILGSTVLFFALTRTQVGRDGLRDQIVWQFNDTFEGRLEISELKGNLLNDLFASEVQLFDPTGRLVLSLDSVVVRPSWRDLLQRTFTAGRLTLIRPRVELLRQKDGVWNLEAALRSRRTDSTGQTVPWSFTSADIRIIDGTATTRNEGDLPEAVAEDHVFNYTDAHLQDLQAQATLEWRPDLKLVDLLRLSGRAPGLDLDLEMLQGQFVLEGERLSINEMFLAMGQTRLDLSASVSPASALSRNALPPSDLMLDLRPSRLSNSELRRLFPALPFADTLTVSARVQGPFSALSIEQVSLERGETRLQGAGTLHGLPDQAAFNLVLQDNTVAAGDLFALLPEADLPDFHHLGLLHVSLESEGMLPLRDLWAAAPLRAAARLSLRGAAGMLEGTVDLAREQDGRLRYTADLGLDTLDVGHITNEAGLRSRLNGRLALHGSGMSLDELDAQMHLRLRPSTFAGRHVDTLYATATAADRRLEGTLFFRQQRGTLFGNAALDLTGALPAYHANLTTDGLNLGPLLLKEALATDVSARLVASGVGTPGPAWQGEADLVFDSSAVRLGDAHRVVPPHRSRLVINPRNSSLPRLALTGDVADLQLRGDVAFEPLFALGRLWSTAFVEAVQREASKPYPRPALADTAAATASAPTVVPQNLPHLREAVRARLRASGIDSSMALEADLHLKRADLLSAFLPELPLAEASLQTRLHVAADADRLLITGSIRSDSLQAGSLVADHLVVRMETFAHLDAPLEETLLLELDAQAEALHVAAQTVHAPSLVLNYRHRGGQIALTTRPQDQAGALRLAAALDLLHDRNRLTLSDFYLAFDDYVWRNLEDEPVDLYADVAVVHGLTLESRDPGSDAVQQLRVHGAFSRAREDTLFADAQNIALRQLSDLAALKRPLQGWINGQLALTGGLRRPELTGTLAVETLVFDNRLLGQLTVTSRYVPGTPDIVLDAFLYPVPGEVAASLPASPERLVQEENRLHVSGMFRLPQFDEAGQRTDPGALALDVAVDRADLFFFEYLFPGLVTQVGGSLTGRGHIGGTLQKPLFEADLQAVDGRFHVPTFNLSYQIEGPVTVDVAGVQLKGAVLRDPTGGAATLSGGLLFNDYRFFSFDFNAALDDLLIMNVLSSNELSFYGKIWASGTATLTGPLSKAFLRSTDLVTSARSETFIPITSTDVTIDPGFIIFADSTGALPDLSQLTRRRNVLSARPVGERTFLDGLEMDLNIFAPSGSTVHLVIDPLLGDVINAVGSGRLQLQRAEGEFYTFGALDVEGGDYLFTAGDVFVRRFLIDEGTISWDGDPVDALLDIQASYRTRASRAGLDAGPGLIPVIVQLHITGRVATPTVDLSLAVDRRDRDLVSNSELLEARLNQPERATEYATSVLLTNSFLLTTELANADGDQAGDVRSNTRNQLAFTSVSQLVSSQLNRYLSQALPNVDFNVGLQGERAQDLDVTYGVALRLLDERLIIRGQGIYQGDHEGTQEGRNLGEFVVEVRLSPSVSVEVFYRREGDLLSDQALTNTTGAGLSYQTQFSTWELLFHRLFGWALPEQKTPPQEEEEVAGNSEE